MAMRARATRLIDSERAVNLCSLFTYIGILTRSDDCTDSAHSGSFGIRLPEHSISPVHLDSPTIDRSNRNIMGDQAGYVSSGSGSGRVSGGEGGDKNGCVRSERGMLS